MPKRKEPELEPKEQFKRFQVAAKEVRVDADEATKSFRVLSAPKAASRPLKTVPLSPRKSDK